MEVTNVSTAQIMKIKSGKCDFITASAVISYLRVGSGNNPTRTLRKYGLEPIGSVRVHRG